MKWDLVTASEDDDGWNASKLDTGPLTDIGPSPTSRRKLERHLGWTRRA